MQRSLFPDAYELEADALDALEALDVGRGLGCIREARRRDASLPNLDALEQALVWLDGLAARGLARVELATRAFLELPCARLSPAAAHFADRALARFGLRASSGGFLDAGERVPMGALLLVEQRAREARRAIADVRRGRAERADLDGYAGDAAFLCERLEDANECYVRALVRDAQLVDVFRLRHPRLAELRSELFASQPEPLARERLFVEAWLRDLLTVPPGCGWLDGDISRLRAKTRQRPGASPEARACRFALLLYLDRSRPAVGVDPGEREEMQALDPDLFGRVMDVLRERETGSRARARSHQPPEA